MMMKCQLLVLLLASSTIVAQEDAPSLQDSITAPVISATGRSVLLTCVVRRLGNNTLLWKYGVNTILTAGSVRITADPRVNVLHDEGGDVYVLQIDNVNHNDTGLYICEVNTEPPQRSFHRLTVLTDQLTAPPPDDDLNSTAVEALWGFSTPKPISHNYTGCCLAAQVPEMCLGFCSIKNILEGSTGVHPSKCDPFFKDIVKCMADGRNHVPCCERNQVPDICQDMCAGEYTVQTDDVRSHLACGSFTAPTLACIAEGIDTLPSRPSALNAENITDTAFTLMWSLDQNSVNPIEFFNINVTLVGDLQHPEESDDSLHASYDEDFETKRYKVEGSKRVFTIDKLRPFSLYNVTMESVNELGKSLPTYTLRILTLSQIEATRRAKNPPSLPEPPEVPKLPDTKQCCRKNNVTHASCVDNFCNPLALHTISVPDVIVCAPWGGQMFDCVRDGNDHTECCKKRDVPDICMGICSGAQDFSALDYRHFRCVEFMPDIANCMLSGYNVLPSEPRDLKFSNVGTNIGLLHWDEPLEHQSTVDGYKITYTLIKPGARANGAKVSKTTLKSPYILEDLEPNSSYEVYVQARNIYGLGNPTSRIVFRTAKASVVDLKASSSTSEVIYDQPDCCSKAGVRDECLPMCQYNASLSEIRRLSALCNDDLAKVTKCAAAGRDHLPCCYKRGVSTECQMLCQGVQYTADHSIFTKCLSFIGNIMMCLEEGVSSLPSPVHNFHATIVEDDKITLVWDPTEGSDQYEVYYKQLENNSSPASAFEHESHVNVSTTSVIVTGLEKDKWYQFFAISRNKMGTSLPTSMVIVNMSKSAWDGQMVLGRPSAPHGIEVTVTGSNSLTFAWTAPVISDHEDLLKYRFTYGLAKNFVEITEHEDKEDETQVISIETYNTNLKLEGLTPNTQYVGFIQTISSKTGMDSPPSETFLAWTDPIVPAFAETPAIHPNEGLKEGDSMTILCIALGSPTPTVTLYLGQHPIRSEKTRHMVTTVHNITRDMQTISCYVDNGYGTPMQSSRTIVMEREPRIAKKALKAKSILGYIGSNIKIECEIDALPAPSMSLGKLDSNFQPDRFNMSTTILGTGVYRSTLIISNATAEDSGDYFCRATNSLGSDKIENIKVVVNNPTQHGKDLMQCCKDQGVKSTCLGICSLNLDLDLLLYDSECIPEFDKLMECGSDGSDHRHCCSVNGVPRECLDWCRGLPSKGDSETCALTHARTISQCFHEGLFALPGPPTNIRVTPTSATTAIAAWDPPRKNPGMVELYRILWRQEGSMRAHKIDTSKTKITIENLTPGVPYELVIKAGNANGTSQLTPPLKFIAADKYIIETSRSYNQTPSIVGALLAVFLLVSLILVAVWYYRGKKYSSSNSAANTSGASRSFENPYFNQEVTMSNLQANDVSGSTMAEAIQASSNDTMDADESGEIQMETMEAERNTKWPKLPGGGRFNNGFGFQRF